MQTINRKTMLKIHEIILLNMNNKHMKNTHLTASFTRRHGQVGTREAKPF